VVDIQGLQLLESCAFTWLFDGATHRFLRMPRDARSGFDTPTDWRPYHRLEIDGSRDCFVVALDEAGTQVLRAWLHQNPCGRCSDGREAVGDAKQRILWWKERLRVVDGRVAAPRTRHPLRPYGGWPQPDGAA
jgi:hypothetical protein